MLKFAKSVKFNVLTDELYLVRCGLMTAVAEYDEAENSFCFTYEHDEHLFIHEYQATTQGVEAAIWEWLCTLSRFTTPNAERTLGKKWKATVSEAA